MVKQRITVLDVARKAGVSQGSVSRVLTGKNWVSDSLRVKVEAAARDLGYSPNPHAQGLKSQRSRAIAALVSDISNPLHGVFLAAAEELLSAAGYLLFVSSTKNDPRRELELIGAYGSGRVDGIIVAHSDESNAELLGALKHTGLPIVFHDREGMELGDAVVADHRRGAYDATKYLLGLGHRKIAVLTPPSSIRPGRERLIGYEEALAEARVKRNDNLISVLDASGQNAYAVAREILSKKKGAPTALICLGTQMLAGVLRATESLSLRIPEDLSLVGIGDTDLVRLHRPPITSVRWDIGECGRLAATLLLNRLRATPVAEEPRFTTLSSAVHLIERGSCVKPGRANP